MLYFYYGVAKVRGEEIREICGIIANHYEYDRYIDDADLQQFMKELQYKEYLSEKKRNPNTNLYETDIEIVIRNFHELPSHSQQGLRGKRGIH